MEKLHELEADFQRAGGELKVIGLEDHKTVASEKVLDPTRKCSADGCARAIAVAQAGN